MATLLYNDGNLRHSRIFANGTRLGGWVLNTADNSFSGVGNFDRDNRKDMVLTSPWGIGIISFNNIAPVFAAPNGTRFGGWLLNTRDNQIQLICGFLQIFFFSLTLAERSNIIEIQTPIQWNRK